MNAALDPRMLGTRPAASPPIPFSRLVRVEWSKATDTRAARWLLGLVALSTAGVTSIPVLVPTSFDQTYTSYLGVAAIGLSILLPVVAILMITGEWSQRSIITTFTQEPRRLRVLNAKLAVALMLSAVGAIVAGAIAAAGLGVAAASGRELEADLTLRTVVGFVLFTVLNVAAGVALGASLQNSAAAIAASFALPATFAVLGTASAVVADWVDTSANWNAVLDGDWSGRVPQILVSVALWVMLPLAAGAARTVRRDVG